jgi:hypothetical protein
MGHDGSRWAAIPTIRLHPNLDFGLTCGAINGTISTYGTNREDPGDDAPRTGKCKF